MVLVMIFFVCLYYFYSTDRSGDNSAQDEKHVNSIKIIEQPRYENDNCYRFLKVKTWLDILLRSQFRLLNHWYLNN